MPLADGLLVRRRQPLWGHEFHRWQIEGPAAGRLWQLEGWGVPTRPEGWGGPTLHASWLHLHWSGQPARRCCASVSKRTGRHRIDDRHRPR
ncbi:MAG: hypothetical protein ACK5E6_12385, partial [Cyanobacteriota bacterium]